MSNKKIVRMRAGIFAVVVLYGISVIPFSSPALLQAAVRVETFAELCREMRAPGKSVVELQRDIYVTNGITMQGEKILRGRGYVLKRGTVQGKVYGGTLIKANGTFLTMQNVILDGGGEGGELSGKIYGRLLEVQQGQVIIKKGCVLERNSNNGQNADGGGAIVVKNGSRLRIMGGEIRGNHTSAGGAGIRVEKGAQLVMTGGSIVANRVKGVGPVEGFDGRGGAIYNRGKVELYGGRVCYNEAASFGKDDGTYGGVGGMLYNAGDCLIAGGRIIGNKAGQAGGGIYSDIGAKLQVKGGIWNGNGSSRGADIFQAGGTCNLYGYQRVLHFEKKGAISAPRKAGESRQTPKRKSGDKNLGTGAAAGKPGAGGAAGKPDEGGAPGKQGAGGAAGKADGADGAAGNQGAGGNGPAVGNADGERILAGKANIFRRDRFTFYQGEYVESAILKSNVNLDVFKTRPRLKIQAVVYGDRRERWTGTLSTGRRIVGRICYGLSWPDSKKEIECPFEIRKNRAPKIQAPPRYFFVSEVEGYSETTWRQVILDGVAWSDDREREAELRKEAELELGEILSHRPGSYMLRLKVRDQYGRRYYMPRGEKRRYGRGKLCRVEIPVVLAEGLAERSSPGEGEVHFEPPDTPDPEGGLPEEIWNFKKKDIKKVKQYMGNQADPFSKAANDGFLERFAYCREEMG